MNYCLACFNGDYVIPPCQEGTKLCLDESNALTW
jgi:amidophosphoribosyltransferase